MKKKSLLLMMLFAMVNIYAQEICTNGVDDDNDGLIDLNDTDCVCSNTVNVPSLIPNPSFEDYDFCPNFFSQLEAATTWIQATSATSDYFNSCGYMPNCGVTPFPNGNGAVGGFAVKSLSGNPYLEYIGACLLSPLVAGTNYQIQVSIASKPIPRFSTNFSTLNIGNFQYDPIDITIFGTANCNNLPVFTYDCPTNENPNWVVLGSAQYQPNGEWGVLTISFTPQTNINAVMLGGPCNMSDSYNVNTTNGVEWLTYFFYDNLILNRSSIFQLDPSISSTGNICDNTIVLSSSNSDPSYSYQWYLNGIAIANATSPTFQVTNFSPTASYSLRIGVGNNCFISDNLVLNTIVPASPIVESPISLCQNGPTAPLTAIGDNVRWYAEAVGGIGSPIAPTPATNVPGTYTYYVSQTCGLESPRESITVVVNPRLIPNFQEIQPLCFGSEPPILNGSSPNGIAGTWSPSSINTTQNDSYNFTPNVNVCANEQTLNVEIIPSIEFGIFGRCSDGAYEMEAIPTKGTFDNNTLTFEWTDQNGNPLGVNQSVINLTEIVENTIAVELFPQDYRLSITDTNGCTATSTYTVEKVFCRIPSGISPNGDDKNDNFDLTGLSVTHLSIFNRYGVKVYSKDKYLNEWRGQTDSGHDLPDATYYYYVEFENKKPQTGWVYINR